MKSYIVLFFTLSMLLLSGCSVDMKETEGKIVEFDPQFKESLEKRNALRNMVADQKSQYAQKKENIDKQIELLKIKRNELGRQNAQALEKIVQQIEPDRRQLQRKLIELKRSYDRVLSSLADINKDIREITKLIEKKEDLSLTTEELATWNDRLSTLMKRRTLTETERINLKEEINVTKMKLKVMKI